MTMATRSWSEYDLRKMRCIKDFLKAYPHLSIPELDKAVHEDNLIQAERLVNRIARDAGDDRFTGTGQQKRALLRAIRPVVHQLIWQDMRAQVA